MKTSTLKSALIATLLCASVTLSFAQESKWLAVLKSDAPQKEKADACRELQRVASKESVPVLAGLLGDEKLAHMARYALEPLSDPSVDVAFRDALGKLKGRPLVGVINSIGVRRDAKAITALAGFLTSEDTDVAQTAARALGSIGTSAAAKSLQGVLDKGAPAQQLAVCDGLLRCAAMLPASNAIAIYDRLRSLPAAPQQIRVAALRGAILARQNKGLPLLMEALRGEDYTLALAAVRTSMELPGEGVTKALAAELGKLTGDKQHLLIRTLGNRGDAAALPSLLAVAKSGAGDLRVAAIKSLSQIGNASVVPALVEMAVETDSEVAGAARAGLASFSGGETDGSNSADAAITGMLTAKDPKIRIIAFDLISQRHLTGAIPTLLRLAEDADATIAGASIKTLGEVAGAPEVPALIKILLTTKTAAAENALAAVCTRTGASVNAKTTPPAYTEALVTALAQAAPEQKMVLLRVLRFAGGPQALTATRAATQDTNLEIRETALRSLCEWPTTDVLSDLAEIVRSPTSPKFKILALRGQLRLIPQQNISPAQKLTALQPVLALVERPEEKRLALAVLGDIPTAESLALVMPDVANSALKEEACQSAVAIGEKLAQTQPSLVADAMRKVVKATGNKNVAKRARSLLDKTKQ